MPRSAEVSPRTCSSAVRSSPSRPESATPFTRSTSAPSETRPSAGSTLSENAWKTPSSRRSFGTGWRPVAVRIACTSALASTTGNGTCQLASTFAEIQPRPDTWVQSSLRSTVLPTPRRPLRIQLRSPSP